MTDDGHVFISYSRKDGAEHAERLEAALKPHFRTWRDTRNIDPTQDFTAEIENGIEAASHVVVCVTPDSKRGDSFVRREIQYALLSKKPVIPLRFAEIPPHISIINFEWIDLFKAWDTSFERLCAILNSVADEYRDRKVSDDPYYDYLKALYERIVYYLNQTVFSLITLSSEATPDAVERVVSQVLPMAFFAMAGIEDKVDQKTRFNSFHEAFEQYGGRVLLLGEPGAGKTTTLFAFARDAVAARLEDSWQPLPILATIATWNSEKQLLADWLAGEISALHAGDMAGAIATGKAVLMLDGLDELGGEREESLTAESRKFLQRFVPDVVTEDDGNNRTLVRYDPRKWFMSLIPSESQIVVTCRIKDYQEIGEKIYLKGAVTLQKMTDPQIQDYLKKLPDLWRALQNIPDLIEVVRIPLLLKFFAEAFRADTTETLRGLGDLSQGDLRDVIFKRYVTQRYEHEKRKPYAKIPFTPEEIYRVLGHVAMINAGGFIREKLSSGPTGQISVFEGSKIIENVIEREDFEHQLPKHEIDTFIEFVTRLNLITSSEQGTHHFVHLLLRDYFVYDFCMLRIREPRLYPPVGQFPNPAEALGRIADPRALPAIIDLLGEKSVAWNMRAHAASGLRRARNPMAVKPLMDALQDEVGVVRSIAASALGYIGDKSATSILIATLEDEESFVQFEAAEALERIGTPEAMEAVERWRREQGKGDDF